MFGFNWLKPILKKRMRPVPPYRARKMVNTLSTVYAFVGWNVVTFCLYLTWKQNIPEGPEKLRKFAEILDVDKAQVIRFSGFQKVADYEIDRTEEIEKLKSENISQKSSTSI